MRLLAMLFILIATMALSILILIFGWGMTPQSWPVIIGGGIAALMLHVIARVITE